MPKVNKLYAREILDSRGVPTIETACLLDNGLVAVASVPSGTSTGSKEALELRDNDQKRFFGMGVQRAVKVVNEYLSKNLSGLSIENPFFIEKKMIEMDGTEDKSYLGANSILSVSVCLYKALSLSLRQPLYKVIFSFSKSLGINQEIKIPTPIFNMINGGAHGAGNLDFQEFHVIPATSKSYSDALRMGAEIYHAIGEILKRTGAIHSVGVEGGYAPNLFTNFDALRIFTESIIQTGYEMGRDAFLGLDVAANYFFKDGKYTIRDQPQPLTPSSLLEYYQKLHADFKLAILEDPFYEEAWDDWKNITQKLGEEMLIVGDDLLVTNPSLVDQAISQGACNAILIKPNQVGTIYETLQVIKKAREARWKVIVSHRSGETNDTFIADFAVGIGAEYAKFGAPSRGERVAKYNRLLGIEMEVKENG